MSQKLPVTSFKWVKKISRIDKDFIKTMMKIVIKDIFLKLILNIQKDYMCYIVIFHFYQKE